MYPATHIVQEWFKENDQEFKVLLWPPNSLDFKLIEHLWDVLYQQVLIQGGSTSQPTGLERSASLMWY